MWTGLFARNEVDIEDVLIFEKCITILFSNFSYLVSGDGDGKVCIWDWKTTRMMAKWKAHDKACVAAIWHPHETSKVATASWDNSIKFWD